MPAALTVFTVVGLADATAVLASYAVENGLTFDWPAMRLPRLTMVPARASLTPAPDCCEATRRWRHPVTRAFVKAPTARCRLRRSDPQLATLPPTIATRYTNSTINDARPTLTLDIAAELLGVKKFCNQNCFLELTSRGDMCWIHHLNVQKAICEIGLDYGRESSFSGFLINS